MSSDKNKNNKWHKCIKLQLFVSLFTLTEKFNLLNLCNVIDLLFQPLSILKKNVIFCH